LASEIILLDRVGREGGEERKREIKNLGRRIVEYVSCNVL